MIAIIIYGPPGSGKGTQSKLLADKLDLVHFDTGFYIREVLYNPKLKKDKIIQKEKLLNESGKLNTPSWVLKIITGKTKEIERLGKSIIFSGSPRTILEAFGDKEHRGLMDILKKFYGKKNIFIFVLKISPKESIKRNSKRLLCSVCRTPILSQAAGGRQMLNCPFCGGKLESRFDDKKEIILARLKEYREKTLPIQKELKKRGYKVININGEALPFKIHQRLNSFIT